MDNCITCSSLRCSSPDRKLRTKCATSYAVFCIRIAYIFRWPYAIDIGFFTFINLFVNNEDLENL